MDAAHRTVTLCYITHHCCIALPANAVSVAEAELGPWGLSYYLLHFSLCIETQLTVRGALVAFTLICICPTPFHLSTLHLQAPLVCSYTWQLTLPLPQFVLHLCAH